MKYKIICDSSCDLEKNYLLEEYGDSEVGFEVVSFVVTVGQIDYIDDALNDSAKMLESLNSKRETYTSCPAPVKFEEACTADYNFIVTISSKLSGSFNSANVAVELSDKQVFVIDSKGTGGVEQLIIDKLHDLMVEGKTLEEIKEEILAYRDQLELYFTISSFDNLVKKGRIKKGLARIIQTINMKLLCKAKDGEIYLYKKCLSLKHCFGHMCKAVSQKIIKRKKCIITYIDNYDDAVSIKNKLAKLDMFEKIELKKAKILNSFYALQKGLIVSF